MPQIQIQTKPQPAKKLIDAGMPKNISASDQAALQAGWDDLARHRNEAIEKETKIPSEASVILKYELHKFGKWWVGYARQGKKLIPLLHAPSLPDSAVNTLMDKMSDDMVNS